MRRGVTAALAGLAVALAGCGGEDKPTREEFAASADEVCADVDRETKKIEGDPNSPAEVIEFAVALRASARDAAKRVRALELPEEDADRAEQWQEAVAKLSEDRLIPALDDLERAARAENAEGMVEAAQRIQTLSEETETRDLARGLGMKTCAK